MYRTYPENIDCVWLAADRKQCLAAFITGGCAPIPEAALSSNVMQIEEIEGILYNLPVYTQALLAVAVPRPDDFVALSERGLYVFDWQDVHRTNAKASKAYELVSAPALPLTTAQMKAKISANLAELNFEQEDFSSIIKIDPAKFVPCVWPQKNLDIA